MSGNIVVHLVSRAANAGLLFIAKSPVIEDAWDLFKGAHFVPQVVTEARKKGQVVLFIQEGTQLEWYWLMPNNARVYHGSKG